MSDTRNMIISDIVHRLDIVKYPHGSTSEATAIDHYINDVEYLLDIVEEYDEAHQKVIEDKCATDEIHCGCVGYLRLEIAKLKAAGDRLIDEAERVTLAVHAPDCAEKWGDECNCYPNLKRAIEAMKEANNDQTS